MPEYRVHRLGYLRKRGHARRHDDRLAGARDLLHERQIDERLRTGESIAAEYLEHVIRRCQESAGTILVVEFKDTIAGFVAVLARVPYKELDQPPGEYALVSDLVVREDCRRRGFGAALMREAERCAKDAGAVELRIGVLSADSVAKRLYGTIGFTPYLETLTKRLE